jgi:predicted trehalose synthase
VSDATALTRLVAEQRWFGSKSRELADGRAVDAGELAPGCMLALFEVMFAGGGGELYQLPYRVTGNGEPELSLADPELALALLAALRRAQPVPTAAGTIEFELTGALPGELPGEPAPAEVRPVGGEQSNSSIVFGEQVILKAYRRLEGGESPELELLRFLADHGFEHTPRLLGWYRYSGPRTAATLGILQTFASGARDGWELALASFGDPGSFLSRLERLGEVTARMHAVLASDAADPAFRPEAPGAELAGDSEADARAVLASLAPGGPAEPVRARADEVIARLRCRHRLGTGGRVIRQHGDYHLGQVLWADGDWLVLDFEGEPARPLAERRRKSSPLRDVAGMLRSFAYVAETVRERGAAPPAGWEHRARAAFLRGYQGAIDQMLLPPAGVAREELLAACELEKALYELRYELDHRPAWVHVPVAGILRLLDDGP